MISRKTTFIMIAIAALVTLLIVSALVIRNQAVNALMEKLNAKASSIQLEISAETASPWNGFTCFKSIHLHDNSDSNLKIENLCLSHGLTTIFSDAPTLDITCDSITGNINLNLPQNEKENTKKESNKHTSALKTNGTFVIKNINLDIAHNNIALNWQSSDTRATLNNGNLQCISTGIPKTELADIPIKPAEIPLTQITANLSLTEKTAHIDITPQTELQVVITHRNHSIQTSFTELSANLSQEIRSLSIQNLEFSGNENLIFEKAGVDNLKVDLTSFTPSIESIQAIQLTSPHISFKLDKLLSEESIAKNPVIKTIQDYWNQKAGSILGQAPNNSVRKEDIKKNKKVARKNPLSQETLNAFKTSFENFQKKIMLLPAVDIQNGQLNISEGEAQYDFNAISFNTAELFKNSQQFELAFNVREASAAFTLSYESDTPYPTIEFEIKNLASPDFLNIINMPIPDKNSGTISTKFAFSINSEQINLNGKFNLVDFALFHQKISPNIIENVNASAEFNATYQFADDKLTINPLSMTSGPVTATGFINISNLRSDPVIDFELGSKDLKCSDIPKAIPKGFLPTITDLRLTGLTMSPKITGKIPWKNPLISTLKETGFENKCYPVSVAPHFPERLNDDDYTFTTDYTYFADAITVGPGTKTYTRLEKIPPYVKAAMFLTEDKRFFDHGPLRIAFIERALRLNLNARKYVYGGSTIGQQLTKNLFLNRSKNLARKLEEAFITWRMVEKVPKLRIFELYLNVIEFGPDIYGIHQAAKFYFDKEPINLTPLEGAFLASLKVSPSKGGRFYKFGFSQKGKWWHKRMKYIMKVLAENGYISVAEVIAANDWTPQFSYPTSPSDYRQRWLNQYGEYLQEQAKKARQEE